ncbi:MAG: glycoside hydrolase family 130 protein [Anaerolineae bacterium]
MDLAKRFPENPIMTPRAVKPSRDGVNVQLTLNPGAFRYQGRTGLVMRVAEHPIQKKGYLSTLFFDPAEPGGVRILEFREGDPDLMAEDPRKFTYRGTAYLSSISHLRLAWSDGGIHFTAEDQPALVGLGELEAYGVEDCRVVEIEGRYILTYTSVSAMGIGVSLSTTTDWKTFRRYGMVLPPTNKDVAVFPEQVGGRYLALHRPIGVYFGGLDMWVGASFDLSYWGDHRYLAGTRSGMWDSARIGAGAAPVRTEKGWLEIYHGADATHRYCLGAMLLDLDEPWRVIARSQEPIMEPTADYERKGFFGDVIFTNGHVVDGDTITLYYGASDEVICGATLSIADVLASLNV